MTEDFRIKEHKQIVALSKHSDRNAFDFLFKQYSARVYHFSFGYLKSTPEAEEIVQDTFVRIWENRASIDPENSFSGFVFTIAYRLILNRIRKLRNELNCMTTLLNNLPQAHNDTEQTVVEADLQRIHAEMLHQLPPGRRKIFQMIREDGMTYKQVADQLNISVKTVESQMAEALKHFRNNLSI